MSDSQISNFGKFVPGFDFLQNLAKSATQSVPQMPNMAHWIAPTMSVEDLEKRINELKAVHFWLDQNSRALGATVQALEVQKMTLSTLKGMNFNLADVANAFKLKAADSVYSGVQKVTEKAASTAKTVSDVAGQTEEMAKKVSDVAKPAAAAAIAGLVDPMHLWSALTQQFQAIAASAMKEAGKTTAMDAAMDMGKNMAKEMVKNTAEATSKMVAASAAAKKTAAKKAAAKKTDSSDS
ncbi:MAG: PhaM family polyhydroxyalkanoate granule multifunctional regulatory protein [Rhodoferax sp.]